MLVFLLITHSLQKLESYGKKGTTHITEHFSNYLSTDGELL